MAASAHACLRRFWLIRQAVVSRGSQWKHHRQTSHISTDQLLQSLYYVLVVALLGALH